jgi:hypothetical protein
VWLLMAILGFVREIHPDRPGLMWPWIEKPMRLARLELDCVAGGEEVRAAINRDFQMALEDEAYFKSMVVRRDFASARPGLVPILGDFDSPFRCADYDAPLRSRCGLDDTLAGRAYDATFAI